MTIDEEDFENLLMRLVSAEKKRQRRVRVLNAIGLGLFVTGILCPLVFFLLLPYLGFDPKPYDRFSSYMPAIGASGIIFRCLSSATSQQKKALRSVLACADIRAVGPLVDAMEYTAEDGSNLHKSVVVALTGLLPQLQATDSALLTQKQRRLLIGKLKMIHGKSTFFPHYADFHIAILKAWEQVGGKSEVSQVERLATMQAETEHSRRVQEAARACLPFLLARAEQKQMGNTLLRAVNPGVSAEILLRPAVGSADTQEQVLLRATSNSEEQP